jgi:hypothetical protein
MIVAKGRRAMLARCCCIGRADDSMFYIETFQGAFEAIVPGNPNSPKEQNMQKIACTAQAIISLPGKGI